LTERKEGFAVVDTRGNVYRIDERTTGEHWRGVQAQLAAVDRAGPMSMAAARDEMKERNSVAFREKKEAERNAARPATAVEVKILEAHMSANGDRQKFEAALHKISLLFSREVLCNQLATGATEIVKSVGAILPNVNLSVRVGNFVDDHHGVVPQPEILLHAAPIFHSSPPREHSII
jgi:hypothetical protein